MRASLLLPSLAALVVISSAATVPGLPSCAGSCVGTDFGGCGTLNVQCICSNTALIASLACCVSTACDAADQEATIQFADSLCAGYSVSNLPTAATCASTSGATSVSSGSSVSVTSTGSAASSASSSLSSALSSASAAAATVTSSAASAASASSSHASTTAGSSSVASSSAAAATTKSSGGSAAYGVNAGFGVGAVIAGAFVIL